MPLAQSAQTAARPQQLPWPIIAKGNLGVPVHGDASLQVLHGIGTKVRVPSGETIFNEGDPATFAYKVVSGVVRICRHLSDGRRQIAQFLFPGELFSFMETSEYHFTAEAISDAVLIALPLRQLGKLRDDNPSLQERFLTVLSQRVIDAQDHLAILGRQMAKERVASFLLFLWKRIGDDDDDILDVPMTRLDIADYLGLTIETVCRVLSEMKREGIVAIPDARHLTLLDIPALQTLAEGGE